MMPFGRKQQGGGVHEVTRGSRQWKPQFELLSAADKAALVARRPKVLTGGEGRPIQIPLGSRPYVCLLEDGVLVATRGNEEHPGIRDAYDRAVAAGIEVRRFVLVEIDDVKRLDAAGDAADYQQADTLVAMQKSVLDVFSDALNVNATDVKVQVGPNKAEVFFCINNLFYPYRTWDAAYGRTWLEACFNLARGSDGTYKEGRSQKARIASTVAPLPGDLESLRLQFVSLARGGRGFVARLLKARSYDKPLTMQGLGYDREHVEAAAAIRANRDGVIIYCGPTGSGKSTSLVVSLEARFAEMGGTINIVSIEDPAEYEIPCAMQMESVSSGTEDDQLEAFNDLFHSALRMKPHVIMVGEVRGKAAGKLLIAAAQSGHQVWTTIHASNALTVPSRLHEMGIERYLVRDPTNIVGIIFQRLLATLCPDCRTGFDRTRKVSPTFKHFLRATTLDFSTLRFHNPAGCPTCTRKNARVTQLGYSGQTVCAEVVEPTGALLDACLAGERELATSLWLSKPGAMTAMEHGIRKMNQGLIDPMTVFNSLYDPATVDRLAADRERLHSVVTGQWPAAPDPRGGPPPRLAAAAPARAAPADATA